MQRCFSRPRSLTKVDQLGDQDADGDGQLEHDVELPAHVHRRHLGEVHRYRLGRQTCRVTTEFIGGSYLQREQYTCVALHGSLFKPVCMPYGL